MEINNLHNQLLNAGFSKESDQIARYSGCTVVYGKRLFDLPVNEDGKVSLIVYIDCEEKHGYKFDTAKVELSGCFNNESLSFEFYGICIDDLMEKLPVLEKKLTAAWSALFID